MGAYSSVFEFRWLGWKNRDIPEIRGHTLAWTFWIDLAATMAFHDPTCGCGTCDEWKVAPAAPMMTETKRGDNRPQANADAKPQFA
jgi:hypothetical protein